MIEKIKKILKNKLIQQIIKFGIVGGTSFILDYGIFTMLNQALHIHYMISSIISFSISVIYNYILSIKWVFDITKRQTAKEFIIFIILSIIGLGLNSLIMYVCVEFMKIHEMGEFSK